MYNLDNWNYYGDSRVAARDRTKPVTAFVEHEDGSSEEVELPTKWEVCNLCEGKGTHVNPSIDAGGITADDFYDDPEFSEDYMNGTYDQPCNQCKGRTTIRVVDEKSCDSELLALYKEQEEDDYQAHQEQLSELKMGA